MPHRAQQGRNEPDTTTLDTPAGKAAAGRAMAAGSCPPGECHLGEVWTKWHGLPNAECPRCGFATIDEAVAKARNPSIKWPS
jgi:hypothetical protein